MLFKLIKNACHSILLVLSLWAMQAQAVTTDGLQIQTGKGTIPLSQYRGQVVYLDFWASWCAPCRKSFPWLNQMQHKYASKGFKVIAVNLDKESELAQKFLKEFPADFQIGYDPQGRLASSMKVTGMPSSYLIDRTGQIVSSHVGFREKEVDEMEAKIKKLISN